MEEIFRSRMKNQGNPRKIWQVNTCPVPGTEKDDNFHPAAAVNFW
jgi:hypothetical protein